MTDDTETRLVERLRRGDGEAFAEFFEKWKGPVFSYLVSIVRNRDNAEDLLQDVFIKVISGIKRYTHKGRLKQWVMQIAYNAAMDFLRKHKRERGVTVRCDEEWAGSLPGKEGLPDERLQAEELGRELARAVDTLPKEQRTVLHMRTRENLSFREIAEVMGSSVNTALGRMHYAVSALRKHLRQTAPEAEK
jgi:RNA polymerase sigma-70 factor (ECF subfamily)